MKLSAPKKATWWIAVIIVLLGVLGFNGIIGWWNNVIAFYTVVTGFVVLVLGTLFKEL